MLRAAGWGFPSTVGVGAAAAVIALGLWLGGPSFREAFMANFLATVAGVAVGVPVAVWLALRESREQTDARHAQEQRHATLRRRAVLAAIRQELEEDRESLFGRRRTGKREFVVPFLQDEVWGAMSDGGELRWVDDPSLLRQLARSYHFVRTITILERQVFEIRHYPGSRYDITPDQFIVKVLDRFDEIALAAIDEGIAAIETPTL